MLRQLHDVTLFAIDCFTPELTLSAMRECVRWCDFKKVMLITDTRKFPKLHPAIEGIEIVHREQSKERRSVPGIPGLKLPVDYEMDVLALPSVYLKTPFLLHVEWDSAVLNGDAWWDEFLNWDYIGAPWPYHDEPGWPKCDLSNNVGNGGFSLKSRKFCNQIRKATEQFKGDPAMISSDRWQCRTMRPWMEGHGIKYAPSGLASSFSCEGRVYGGQFGFHGKQTVKINNWSGQFFDTIKGKAT